MASLFHLIQWYSSFQVCWEPWHMCQCKTHSLKPLQEQSWCGRRSYQTSTSDNEHQYSFLYMVYLFSAYCLSLITLDKFHLFCLISCYFLKIGKQGFGFSQFYVIFNIWEMWSYSQWFYHPYDLLNWWPVVLEVLFCYRNWPLFPCYYIKELGENFSAPLEHPTTHFLSFRGPFPFILSLGV